MFFYVTLIGFIFGLNCTVIFVPRIIWALRMTIFKLWLGLTYVADLFISESIPLPFLFGAWVEGLTELSGSGPGLAGSWENHVWQRSSESPPTHVASPYCHLRRKTVSSTKYMP